MSAQTERDVALADKVAFDLAVRYFNAVNTSCKGPPPPQKPGGVPYNALAAKSGDPNEKTGPGFGAAGFVAANQTLPYEITFENDPTKATAPALEVTVTDQLDKNLDWTTFSLGAITFGSNVISVPPGLQSYTTTVATTNTDGTALDVDVSAYLDLSTGVVTWTFRSVDPATGQLPIGVQDGFLPVEDGSGRGIASVLYTIKPKAGLPNGATFSNSATVVFDTNAPITTNSVPGTVDSAPPTSAVSPLPATESTPSFTVSWSGSDAGGSGIATYDILVSTNRGAFVPFLTGTTTTSATFTGATGNTYAFESFATDNVGNQEAAPGLIQTTTVTVPTIGPPPPSGYGAGRDAFVETLYQEELGRLPEPSGLKFWSRSLARGASPKTVTLAIARSPEHRAAVKSGVVPRISLRKALADALRAGREAAKSHATQPAATHSVKSTRRTFEPSRD